MTASKETSGERAHRLAVAAVLRAARAMARHYNDVPYRPACVSDVVWWANELEHATSERAVERRAETKNKRLLGVLRKAKR